MYREVMAARIKELLGARAEFAFPLSGLTTWKAGGPAWCAARVNDLPELLELRRMLLAEGVNYFVLGAGSNLLFADRGYCGVIICLGGHLAEFALDNGRLAAGGGAGLNQVANYCAGQGLSGLEWAAGIPGSIGGAVAMNAGSLGGNMAASLEAVSLLLDNGSITELSGGRLPAAAYRKGNLPAGSILLKAWLKVLPGLPAEIAAAMRSNLLSKQQRFPLEQPNAGSVFKNPPNDFAGRLIEAAGLKGLRLGNAQISAKHANFIVNLGAASADDILGLIRLAQSKVWDMFAVKLETEVMVVPYDLG